MSKKQCFACHSDTTITDPKYDPENAVHMVCDRDDNGIIVGGQYYCDGHFVDKFGKYYPPDYTEPKKTQSLLHLREYVPPLEPKLDSKKSKWTQCHYCGRGELIFNSGINKVEDMPNLTSQVTESAFLFCRQHFRKSDRFHPCDKCCERFSEDHALIMTAGGEISRNPSVDLSPGEFWRCYACSKKYCKRT